LGIDLEAGQFDQQGRAKQGDEAQGASGKSQERVP
jgi:hypothetical protein